MSDVPDTSPTMGEIVDTATEAVATDAAMQAASAVEPSDTTVVVEPATTDVTATGLDAASHMKAIAREECDAYMTELVAYQAAQEAASKPDVVVIAPEPAPAPAPTPEPAPKPEKPERDEAPPMAKGHPYFRPLTKKKK